ncbi:hypothetical protein C2S51_034406 [Perilla frutescens var. frutescens]|nr:hypothetical protein C2S51_034406 [Perilla frutescens var. frutescens]
MSRNYDNWERLVAAVLKREQIWKLCHQDSISSSIFSDDESDLELGLRFSDVPFSLGSFRINRTFEWGPQLGEGEFGTTNTALLLRDVRVSDQKCFPKGSKAAIKLLKTVEVTEDEFKQRMIVLGNCRHENVGQPQAYFYSHKTKLIVYDYYAQGSVSDMLHGPDHGSRPDWESRLRIAVGAARGIAHIHTQLGGTMAHGNIKSSNIFLNSQHLGCGSDFGLAGIMESSQQRVVGGPWKHKILQYVRKHDELKKPSQTQSQSQMSDVYNFGLFLLELVTRESPAEKANYIVSRLIADNERSFNSFDHSDRILVDEKEMADDMRGRFPFVDLDLDVLYVHRDLHKMLHVAKRCLARTPTCRPTMSDVVFMLQNIYRPPKLQSYYHDAPTIRRRRASMDLLLLRRSPTKTQITKCSEKYCAPTELHSRSQNGF